MKERESLFCTKRLRVSGPKETRKNGSHYIALKAPNPNYATCVKAYQYFLFLLFIGIALFFILIFHETVLYLL